MSRKNAIRGNKTQELIFYLALLCINMPNLIQTYRKHSNKLFLKQAKYKSASQGRRFKEL